MSKNHRVYYRYSNCFKEKVVQEVSAVKSISEVCRIYGIMGGRKPDHILGADIRATAAHFGRDRFFSLLRRNGLLVQRQLERFPGPNMDRE